MIIQGNDDSPLANEDIPQVLTLRCTKNTSSKSNNNNYSAIITMSTFISDNDIASYSHSSNKKYLFNDDNHIMSQVIEELMRMHN